MPQPYTRSRLIVQSTVPIPPPPPPPPPPPGTGRPLVGINGMSGFTIYRANTAVLSATKDSESAGLTDGVPNVVRRIDAARAAGKKLVFGLTGGSHSQYLANGLFSFMKWSAKMDTYNTEAIRSAIAAAVADGTVLWDDILDEPQADDWGGNITRATIAQMVSYVKSIFPTLPCWLSTRTEWRLSDGPFTNLDGVLTQYIEAFGSITAWRDAAYANMAGEKAQLAFSINVGNGGAGFGETSCPIPPTGGTGVSAGRCATGYGGPTSQLEVWGNALMAPGPLGQEAGALFMWDDDPHIDGYYAAAQSSMAVLRALCDSLAPLSRYRKP